MKIHILGDSLVQTRQPRHSKFFCGWGDMLRAFFNEDVEILNYAMGGRSSRSFLNEGRFYDNGQFSVNIPPLGMGPALPRIEKGDYVLIQFMCNDDDSNGCSYRVNKHVWLGTPDADGIYPTVVPTEEMITSTDGWDDGYEAELRSEGFDEDRIKTVMETTAELIGLCGGTYYSFDCGATYKGYHKFYIDKIREKGAFPVLVVSGALHKFTDGKLLPISGYHGGKDAYHDFPYEAALHQLAEELSVPILDLSEIEKGLYETLGPEKVRYLHNLSVALGDVQNIDDTNQFGTGPDISDWSSDFERRLKEKDFISFDGCHKNHFGAFVQGAILADKLYDLNLLRAHIRKTPAFFPGMPESIRADKPLFASLVKNVDMFGEN